MTSLAQFAVGGATRPDALTGLDNRFSSGLAQMFAAAPPEVQGALKLSSAYRSPEVQAGLYQNAVAKYGSPEAARKWVAPPGHSQHNHGMAADLQFGNDAARQWAHQNAAKFGLAFPLGHEAWHVELAGARGGDQQAQLMPPVVVQPPQAPPQQPGPQDGQQSAQMLPPMPVVPPNPAPPPQAPGAPAKDSIASMFAPNPWAAGLAAGQQYLAQQQNADQREADRRSKLAAMFAAV